MQFWYSSSSWPAVHVTLSLCLCTLRSGQTRGGARSDLPCSKEEDHRDADRESLSWKEFIHKLVGVVVLTTCEGGGGGGHWKSV